MTPSNDDRAVVPDRAAVALGAKGGRARAAKLTPERLSAIAKQGADARWPAKATHVGKLQIGGATIDCAVLADGTRVLSKRGIGRAIGRGYGSLSKRDGGAELPFFLQAKVLKPYISEELLLALSKPIPYRHTQGGGVAQGIEAKTLPMICEVWLRAKDDDVLRSDQMHVANRAQVLMRALAHVAIVALVDEATGYQDVRDRQALQAILDKYLRKEFAAWARRFPEEFYREIFRLKNWEWRGMKVNRPIIVAHYTRDLVYARLAPGLLKELGQRNPPDERGHRKAKHHQWLTEEVGHVALAQHLHSVVAMMRASESWDGLKKMMDRAFPKYGENYNFDFMTSPD